MQQPNRFSIIETAHRGIRNALSQLSLQAGAIDYTNPAAVALLKDRALEVMALLDEHAHTENTLILPLLDGKAHAGTFHDREEHEEIHRQQEALVALLDRLQAPGLAPEAALALGRQFYQDLSRVHAAHLHHMIEEERGSQVMIWQHYSDDDLRQVQGKILQQLNPDLRLAWMRYILPALPPADRQRMISIQKASMPPQMFERLEEMAMVS